MPRCKWIDATAWTPVDAPDWSVVCTGLRNDETMNMEEWKHELSGYFERYAFGCEIAPDTKRRHFQFRGVLKSDLDNNTTVALACIGLRHVTPTKVRDFDYVYKDKNFFCSWDVFRPEYEKVMNSPHVWQVQLEDVERVERTIEIVVDEKGNSGRLPGRCIRIILTVPYTSPLSSVASIWSPVSLGSVNPIGTSSTHPAPSSSMMIGPVPSNN
uniref:Replication-associated protein n=1 Tax=Cressdnaviricota sp. TaxID=2748378 RepID=A0A4D6J0K3_9VIRU|nr:replication-associated protein [Cressdnaviricota sp.]